MNILLINHYAGSVRHGMEYRPYYLAREWVRRGHQVQILAAQHAHVRRETPALDGRDHLDETIDGIRYRWLRTPAYEGNGLGRVRNMFAFVARLWRDAGRIAASLRPHAVIASSTYPLDIWPAHRIARLSGARLLHEVHDLWPLSPMELGGYSRLHPFIMLLQAAEDHACRHADAIVSMLPKVHSHLEARGMAPGRLHIVPNGFDPNEWQAAPAPLPEPLAGLLARLRADGKTVVGYAGSHGTANALETLIEAAARLRREALAFVLVGDGPDKAALRRRAISLRLDNLHFAEPVPRAAIPALVGAIDIGFLGWRRQPLYRFGISPNKLLDYMMGARPVLHAVDAGNDPVAEAGCGLSVAPEDPEAVATGLRRLLALGPEARLRMGARGRDYALRHLAYPVLAERFLDVLEQEVKHV